MYLAALRKLKVSVLSANFKKCRFCNFSGSYTKRSPLEKWSGTKTYSGIVTGASWIHFKPRKIKVCQKKSLTPFFHRGLKLYIYSELSGRALERSGHRSVSLLHVALIPRSSPPSLFLTRTLIMNSI